MHKVTSVLAISFLALLAAPAGAQIQPATATETVSGYDSYNIGTGGTITTSSCSGSFCGSGTATVTLTKGVGYLDAKASASGPGSGSAAFADVGQANIGLVYYFELSGPADSTAELNFSAFQSSTGGGSPATNSPNALTEIVLSQQSVGGALSQTFTCIGDSGDCGPTTYFGDKKSVITNLSFSATTGSVFEVQLYALAQVGVAADGGGSYQALIDPTVSFASGFDSTGYGLAFSTDVGSPISAVPEPATSLMLMAGVALLARRKMRP